MKAVFFLRDESRVLLTSKTSGGGAQAQVSAGVQDACRVREKYGYLSRRPRLFRSERAIHLVRLSVSGQGHIQDLDRQLRFRARSMTNRNSVDYGCGNRMVVDGPTFGRRCTAKGCIVPENGTAVEQGEPASELPKSRMSNEGASSRAAR
jgi:hypothetical protein